MNTQHNTQFFQQSIFLVNDWTNSDAPVVEQTTLESFLREYCEGDHARAWYVKEVTTDIAVFLDEEGNERERDYSEEVPDQWKEVITFEVREGKHSNILRDRLVDTFETELEANEYHLNGLYWNYCNRSFDAPFHADTREECEAEIRERKAIAEDNASA